MTSMLQPLTQLTGGQTVFGGLIVGFNAVNIVHSAYKAFQANDTDLRIARLALVCFHALNLAAGAITFLGYVSGNFLLIGAGAALSIVCFQKLQELNKRADVLELKELREEAGKGRLIYSEVSHRDCEKSDYELCSELIKIVGIAQNSKIDESAINDPSGGLECSNRITAISALVKPKTEQEYQEYYRAVVRILS